MPRSSRTRRAERRESAEHRRLARSVLSDKGQYQALVKRGHGHCAEAQRLLASSKLEAAK